MLKKIDHIGIAVRSLDNALAFYEAMGIKHTHTEIVESQKVKTAFITVGDVHIELLEPTSADSNVAKSIDSRGEGMHHIAYEVDDVAAGLESLKKAGLKLINETPVPGAHNMMIAFVHPKSVNGVLTELCAHQK